MTVLSLAVACGVAFGSSIAVVPAITRVAVTKRLLDFPDDGRRSHQRAGPRLGGVAVFIGLLAAVGGSYLATWLRTGSPTLPAHAASLIPAMAILFAIGLLDDLRGVSPLGKLLGQTLAALIVCQHGFAIERLAFPPSYVVTLGWLAIPLTVVWLVGVSNAFNLVDGLDGLAGGVGVIVLITVTAAAWVLGNNTVPLYSVALAGALLGFLYFNKPPARIFLGDSGSLVVGFLLAFLSVKGATRRDGSLLALVPIFALSYPLLDTGIAMARRWLRGHPLSRADGRHIHHQLRALGLSPRKALAVIFVEAIAVAVLGLSVTFAAPAMTVAIAGVGGAVLLFILGYGIRWLEYDEFIDAGSILAAIGARARDTIRDTICARDIARVIATARTPAHLNAILEDAADLFRFAHMQLGPSQLADPAHLLADRQAPRVWKLEYPVLAPDGCAIEDGSGQSVVLTIWGRTTSRARAASVEGVATILAGAIGEWSEGLGGSRLKRAVSRRVLSPVIGHPIVVPARIPADLSVARWHAAERERVSRPRL
jgi:UDP-GlcNAc:undecaprenyl-phosphate GlcNAc-1-phosphate transferase